jgi:ankyrin repeat protein
MIIFNNLNIIQDDETALHIAAYHGHVEVVKVLTENQDRFVINARDKVSPHHIIIILLLMSRMYHLYSMA